MSKNYLAQIARSLPARGAWIEITYMVATESMAVGRSPHGEHGLKSPEWGRSEYPPSSLPARGAWIEIFGNNDQDYTSGSLPARGAWIEMAERDNGTAPPSRSPHGEHGLK